MKFRLSHGWFCLMSLIGIISFSLNRPAQAAAPPISLEQYWQKVEQTQAFLAGLEGTLTEADRARLSTLAGEWEEITQVTLPGGQAVPVDHSFLVSHLRANPPDLPRLNQLLTTLLAARSHWPQSNHGPADLDLLKDILAQSQFQWPSEQPSPLAVWWRRLLEYLWNLFSIFLPRNSILLEYYTLVNYGLIISGSLALFLVFAFVIRALLIDFVAQAEIEAGDAAGGELLTAETAFKKAQGLSGGGDYRAAVRYLYLSSLLLLDERGLLRYDRSQTNREYLRNVAHLPKLATALREVIDLFDRVWYGYQPVDEATYRRYAAQVTELHQQR